jgi:hypothetical protein
MRLFRTGDVKRFLLLGCLLLTLAPTLPIVAASPIQASTCDYYVDNEAGSGGNGSQTRPWTDIGDHLADLDSGDTMCVRGNSSGSARVYKVRQFYVDGAGGTVQNGTSGSPITVRAYPGEKVVLRNVGTDSIIYFRGASYWIFEGFAMDNNGRDSSAIRFKHDTSYNILRNNEIYNGNTNGISIYEGHNIGNVIENNHVHHFDAGDRDAHCIALSPRSDDTIIRGNVIHDCSGDSIQLDAGDDTPISEYSKNTQVIDNILYRGNTQRSEDGIDNKGADGLVVFGNEFYGYDADNDWSGAGRAIVVQKGSRNILIDTNIIHDLRNGISCHSSDGKRVKNITIRNNIFYNLSGTYAILIMGIDQATMYHNTIANTNSRSFVITGGGLRGGDIRNNLIYDSDKAEIDSGASFEDVTVGYNGWFDAKSDLRASTDLVSGGSPGFVDAAHHDYHLTADSPARDAGTRVGVTTDFEGDPRPWGSRPDIGADEFATLYLTAAPRDRGIYLSWTLFSDPAPDSYVIRYTYGAGGSDAQQGASPIQGISATTDSYSLTGVTNYVFYNVTVTAVDQSGASLAVSNSVRVMPTDIYVYMPVIVKNSRR